MPIDGASRGPLWLPDAGRQQRSRLRRYLDRQGISDYDEAWRWSVVEGTAGSFWRSVAEEFDIRWHHPPDGDREPDAGRVTGVRWFPGATCNYAECALQPPGGLDAAAVIARSQTRGPQDLSWRQLIDLTARVRAGLRRAGVTSGDRVAGYLPNVPEALAIMLAAASLGAIWTCCAPEMGVAGVLDRLSQVDPTVLVAVDGYRYGARTVDRRPESEAIRHGLTSLTTSVWLPYLEPATAGPAGWISWEGWTAEAAPMEFEAVGFDHPLYVLFSSGTTGKPKPIVHGHGGILLEHAKALGFHFDAGAEDRLFWYTTTGWMMWNFCVSGLLTGSAVVLVDGDPTWPEPAALFATMVETGTTIGGVGAGYLVGCMKKGLSPGRDHDLGSLATLGVTGSPLPAAAAEWVYREVAPHVMLASFSGGTDVCTGFVGTSPLHPVWGGEISCRCLGAAVEVFDDSGRAVVGEEGELVLTQPLPSMPVRFWGDPGDERYRATYFERFPGVWAHGDRATLTRRGTVIITGRSDGTLNRGGVRMGTAEFYAVVEGFEDVLDSLVVHLEDAGGGPGELWLFVVAPQQEPDLEQRLRDALRRDLSPRHVPDRIVAVDVIPRTLSGKKLEVPLKRILAGVPVADALALASVDKPDSLQPFVDLAQRRDASA
jgi:acetoacetyl-CoA synthetase